MPRWMSQGGAGALVHIDDATAGLTIVIPTYNRPELLRACLNSLVAQTDRNFEVIVVDNGSDPATIDGFQKSLSVTYLRNNRNHLPTAYNLGWQNARTPVVCYTDDDATFPPHWVAAMKALIRSEPEAVAWGGPAIELRARRTQTLASSNKLANRIWYALYDRILMEGRANCVNAVSRYGAYSIAQPEIVDVQRGSGTRMEVDAVSTVNMAIKRDVLEEFGGFYPGFHLGYSDGDLMLQLRSTRRRIVLGTDPYVFHHIAGVAPNRAVGEQARNFNCYLLRIRDRDPRFKTAAGLWLFRVAFLLALLRTDHESPARTVREFLRGLRHGAADFRGDTRVN